MTPRSAYRKTTQKSELPMNTKKQKSKNNLISFAVMLILIGITLYMIFKNYSPAVILDIVKSTDLCYILIAFLLMLVYVSLEGISLRKITRSF